MRDRFPNTTRGIFTDIYEQKDCLDSPDSDFLNKMIKKNKFLELLQKEIDPNGTLKLTEPSLPKVKVDIENNQKPMCIENTKENDNLPSKESFFDRDEPWNTIDSYVPSFNEILAYPFDDPLSEPMSFPLNVYTPINNNDELPFDYTLSGYPFINSPLYNTETTFDLSDMGNTDVNHRVVKNNLTLTTLSINPPKNPKRKIQESNNPSKKKRTR